VVVVFDPYDPTKEFTTDGGKNIEYPTVERIYGIHDAVLERDEEAEGGVVNEGQIENALNYIEHGTFGRKPEGVFEKAAHLMKRIVQGHEFADGNKRTGLYASQELLEMNGYDVEISSELYTTAVDIAEGADIEEEKLADMWQEASGK